MVTSYLNKCNVSSIILALILSLIVSTSLWAQTYSVTNTPATCVGNGTITISVQDPPAGSITYALINPSITERAEQSGNVFGSLPAGSYTAAVYNNGALVYSAITTIQNNQVPTPPRITGFTVFNVYTCSAQPPTQLGVISFNVSATEGTFPQTMYLYDSGNNLIDSKVIIEGTPSAYFSGLSAGTYNARLTDACDRSVLQTTGLTITTQSISYNISVITPTTCYSYLTVNPADCSYKVVPMKNMNVSTTGFSMYNLRYAIEYPIGNKSEYKYYSEAYRDSLSLPQDYTTWSQDLRVWIKSPCDSTIELSYNMKLYTPADLRLNNYPDYISANVYNRDLPDRNMCSNDGRTFQIFSLNSASLPLICFPLTVRVTSDEPGFVTSSYQVFSNANNDNNFPVISTLGGVTTKGIPTRLGYTYTYDFTDNKAVKPAYGDYIKKVDPPYGQTPDINVKQAEDPYHLGKSRIYISNSQMLSAGPYPVTYKMISGPAEAPLFTKVIASQPNQTVSSTVLADNLPLGSYQIEITAGGCRKDTQNITLNQYVFLPDSTTIFWNAGTACNSVNIRANAYYKSYPGSLLPFNTNQMYYIYTTSPAASTVPKPNNYQQMNYNSGTNTFVTFTSSNQPTGTYSFQIYYQDYLSPSYIKVPLLPIPVTYVIPDPVPVIDMVKSGGMICTGQTTGTLTVVVTGGKGTYTYAIKPSGSPSYGTPQSSNQFTGLTAGKYMVMVNDGCNIIEQEFTMTIAAGGNIIQGPTSVCRNTVADLSLTPVGPTQSIVWTLPDGSKKNNVNSVVINTTTIGSFKYRIDVVGQSGCSFSDSVTVEVLALPSVFPVTGDSVVCLKHTVLYSNPVTGGVWKSSNPTVASINSSGLVTGVSKGTSTIYYVVTNVNGCADSTSLNVHVFPDRTMWKGTNANWNDPANWDNGVPNKCSYVLISGGKSYYPDLNQTDVASCDTVEFKFGGEVAKTTFLNYNKALAELILNSNRWYMLTSPLRETYSGDYYSPLSVHRLNPAIYMMYYQEVNPQTQYASLAGSWSEPFNTLNEELTPSTNYTVWIDDGKDASVHEPYTLTFPKMDTDYNYYDRGGSVIATDHINRQSNFTGRFIYESNSPAADGSFSVPVSNSNTPSYETLIIGNPFMSHLDFAAFQSTNSNVLKPNYYIWQGGAFEANIAADWGTISTDLVGANQFIAPMQSFIVERTRAFSSEVKFTSSMSVTNPGNNLRSSVLQDILNVRLLRNNERESAVSLVFRRGESNSYSPKKDALTMFSQSVKETAILYSIVENKALSIYTMGNLNGFIQLDIRTDVKGKLTFDISGLENFEPSCEIYLIDTYLASMYNLRETPTYTFDNTTGNIEGRFYLNLSNKTTDIEDINQNNIQVYGNQSVICVRSEENDPVQRIEIYDINGRLLKSVDHVNSSYYNLLWENQSSFVLVVKVITDKQSVVKKLFIN